MAAGSAVMWDFRSWERLAENDGGEGRFVGNAVLLCGGKARRLQPPGFSHAHGG